MHSGRSSSSRKHKRTERDTPDNKRRELLSIHSIIEAIRAQIRSVCASKDPHRGRMKRREIIQEAQIKNNKGRERKQNKEAKKTKNPGVIIINK